MNEAFVSMECVSFKIDILGVKSLYMTNISQYKSIYDTKKIVKNVGNGAEIDFYMCVIYYKLNFAE